MTTGTPASPAPDTRPQLLGIDGVELAMPSGEEAQRAATAFYTRALGLRPATPEPDAGSKCRFEGPFGAVQLRVTEPFAPVHTASASFRVDDLDGMVKRLADAGGELRLDTRHPRRAVVHDPFGNRIELLEAADPTPAMFRTMVDHAIYPMTLIDRDGTLRWASASIERFFGYRPEEVVGRGFELLVAADSMPTVVEAFSNIQDAYEQTPWGGVGVPVDLVRKDGTLVSCELAAITTRRTGLPWYVVVVRLAGYERALDQTVEAIASGAGLGEILSRIVAAIGTMVPDTGVAVGDRWTGEQFEVTAGWATDLLVAEPGSPWARALSTGEDQWVEDLDRLPGPLAALARAEGFQACWVHPVRPALETGAQAAIIIWRPVPGPPTRFMWGAVKRAGQLLSLTLQWDRSHSSLAFAATHDSLTGLANREAFRERLRAITSDRPPHDRGAARATVMYIDLDRFKPVNDDLGHLTGDHVLSVLAGRLAAALRPGDTVARMGGDEFAVLCERMTSPAGAERVADRLLEVIRRPIPAPGHDDVELDASIGVMHVRAGQAVDTVLAAADEAMRAVKSGGRGSWRWHTIEPARPPA